jgi:5-methylcytosine-specific restriction protein A
MKDYICQLCEKDFVNRQRLWDHMHRKKKPCVDDKIVITKIEYELHKEKCRDNEQLNETINTLNESIQRTVQELNESIQRLKDIEKYQNEKIEQLTKDIDQQKDELEYKLLQSISQNSNTHKVTQSSTTKFLITLLRKYPDVIKDIFDNQTELTYPMIEKIIIKIKTKRYVPEALKGSVYYEQEYKCNICDILLSPDKQIDHIIPLHQGGENDRSNLQGLCGSCHGKKTNDNMKEFYYNIQEIFKEVKILR